MLFFRDEQGVSSPHLGPTLVLTLTLTTTVALNLALTLPSLKLGPILNLFQGWHDSSLHCLVIIEEKLT